MLIEEIAEKVKNGEDIKENTEKLWKECRGFIYSLAKRYNGEDMEDLLQEGFLALVDAAKGYDAEAGKAFLGYAAFFVRNRFRRYRFGCCQNIRIPEGVSMEVYHYRKACTAYEKQFGKAPKAYQIAALLGVDEEYVARLEKLSEMGKIQSLSAPLTGAEGLTLGDTIPSGKDLEEALIEKQDLQQVSADLWEAIGKLPEEQQNVIWKHFVEGKSFRECGSRASYLQRKAFVVLARDKKLRLYHEEYIAAAPIHHIGLASFKRTMCSEVERAVIGRDDL